MNKKSTLSHFTWQPVNRHRLAGYDEAIRLYYEERWGYVRIGKKLGVSYSCIANWIRNFAAANPEIHAQMKKDTAPTPEDYAKLQAEVARLQRALKTEHMRAELYNKMIDVAEDMFKISIRKKAGPKQ